MSTPQNTNGTHNTTTNGGAPPLDDFSFASSQHLSLLESKDNALQEIKSDLMDALNKEVKSLDEDSWMFEGPRSQINIISKPGGSLAMRNKKSSSHCPDGLRHESRDFLFSLCGPSRGT